MKQVKKSSIILALVALVMAIGLVGTTWAQMEKVDINTATEQELTQLKKIGPKTAALIVKYRELNGLFKKPEDIMNVKGIGSSIWELNKDRITVGDSTAGTAKTAASDLISKAAATTSSANEKASQLTNEISSQLIGGSGKSGTLETRVMELEKKIMNLEKKIIELEKKNK